jgi:hypothetical protein
LGGNTPKEIFLAKSGDWEKSRRIEKLKNASNMVLDGHAYIGKYEITNDHRRNKESVIKYLESLRIEGGFINSDTRIVIRLSGRSIKKITAFGMSNQVYLKTLAYIPMFIEKAVFVADKRPRKSEPRYSSYKHLVIGIELDNRKYTIRIVLGEENGAWYYRHYISEIEKGSLIDTIQQAKPGYQASLFSMFDDNELIDLLQDIFSDD